MHATTRFHGEDSYYEDATVADERLKNLARGLADTPDGWEWLCGFVPHLRKVENIRTAALVVAAEAVSMRIDRRRSLSSADYVRTALLLAQGPLTSRGLLNAVQVRGDEPAELLAWVRGRYGRKIPIPFKRGIADGVTRLWNEYAVLRYDKPGRPIRFADVLELTHPGNRGEWQGILFRHLITERRGRVNGLDGKPYEPPRELPAIRARWELNKLPVDDRHWLMRRVLDGDEETERTVQLAMAGQSEWLRSWLGGKND